MEAQLDVDSSVVEHGPEQFRHIQATIVFQLKDDGAPCLRDSAGLLIDPRQGI